VLHAEAALLLPGDDRRPLRCRDVSPATAGDVALATLREGLELVCHEERLGVGLHLPVPLSAMRYSSARFRFLQALKSLAPEVRRFLLLELTELPEGLPQSAMTELVTALAPYGRAVLARSENPSADVLGWRGCGLSGVSLDCHGLDPGDRTVQARLAAFAKQVSAIAPACVAYRLPTRCVMLSAWGAGFTHLSGPGVLAQEIEPRGVRLSPIELYEPCGVVGAPARQAEAS